MSGGDEGSRKENAAKGSARIKLTYFLAAPYNFLGLASFLVW